MLTQYLAKQSKAMQPVGSWLAALLPAGWLLVAVASPTSGSAAPHTPPAFLLLKN
jgi:hypothetical protein